MSGALWDLTTEHDGTASGLLGGAHGRLLFEEVAVEGAIRGGLQGDFQHLHTFFQTGVTGAQAGGFQCLDNNGSCSQNAETSHPPLNQ